MRSDEKNGNGKCVSGQLGHRANAASLGLEVRFRSDTEDYAYISYSP